MRTKPDRISVRSLNDYNDSKDRMKKRIMEMMGSTPQPDATRAAMPNKSEAPTYESDMPNVMVERFDSKTGKSKGKKKVPTTRISREEFNSYD